MYRSLKVYIIYLMFETVFVELNKIHVALRRCLLIKLNGLIAKEGTIPFSRIAPYSGITKI